MKNIDYIKLLDFTKKALVKSGLDSFSANAVSNGLCSTSLRGVDSHGIRLLPHYLKSAKSGRKNKKPNFKVIKKYSSLISIDANNAFGHAASLFAVNKLMKIADKNGIAAASIFNSSHCGALASTCIDVAKKNYICIGFTNADSLVIAHNSKEKFFGTNPICVAAPRIEKDPFCFDSATSIISWNKLLDSISKSINLDGEFAADKNGNFTNNPNIATALISFGGYKGFGLASVVEMFTSVYSSSVLAKDMLPMFTSSIKSKRKISQFYVCIKIDGNKSANQFKRKLQSMSDRIRKLKPKNKKNKVMVPNDPEIIVSEKRLKKGIPITDNLYSEFQKIAKSLKFNFNI